MTIALTEANFDELCETAQIGGEKIYQQTTCGVQFNLPTELGIGGGQEICLRDGLVLNILKGKLWQDLHLKRQHQSSFPLTSKFFLSSCSRVCTPNIPTLKNDYEEVRGYNYLYCLPELIETEQWQSEESIQVVMIHADLNYFKQFEQSTLILPNPLKQLFETDIVQPFHRSLGKTTPAMLRSLQQLLDCPYQGFMQQLYLEGKALELLALQFAQWTEIKTCDRQALLRSDDIERLHFAKSILIQHANHPPSLMELARQVGLNDRKLKQGFLKVFGTTVFGYLHDYRMEQSRQLLESSEMSVTEVAHVVGYASLPSFSKAFQRKFGSSPNQYKTKKVFS